MCGLHKRARGLVGGSGDVGFLQNNALSAASKISVI